MSQADDPKRTIRAQIRRARAARPASDAARDAAGWCSRLQELTEQLSVSSLAAFLPSRTEPNIRAYLNWTIESGRRLLLPVPRADGLLDWVEGDGISERIGTLGIPEAVGDILNPLELATVGLIIAPALAVDTHGLRLGQGGGYYDRALGSLVDCPPVYAVVADEEVYETLPADRHDFTVQGAVTPSEIIHFGQRTTSEPDPSTPRVH